MTDDDQIRALLEDAVSDVEPRHGLDTIRSRTAAPARSRRPWVWGVGGAVVATAATVAAVAALGNGPGAPSADPGFAGSTTASTEQPRQTATDQPTAAPPPAVSTEQPDGANEDGGKQVSVPVYFSADTNLGLRLFREFHSVPAGGHELDEAVQDAVTGTAGDPDYGTSWPSGTALQRAQLSDGVLSVDLSGPVTDRPGGMTDTTARLAVQQLVYTAQGVVQDRVPVTFLVDGQPASTLLGVPVDQPVANAPAGDVLAQVWVTTPAEGSRVSSPFTVEGVAAAFEANVQWELRKDRTVVKRGFTTAEECCTMSPYSFEVAAPPGEYTLVVHDEDASGEHPGGLWQDTKRVTVE